MSEQPQPLALTILTTPSIALCAFRYALGRTTYVTTEVGKWLIKNRDKFPACYREQIARDIALAIDEGAAGMPCDVEVWERVREAMLEPPATADAARGRGG